MFPLVAITFDPRLIVDNSITPNRGFIMLNDGGLNASGGFPERRYSPNSDDTIPFDPVAMDSYNVFEHEMTHYLGRFHSRCYPFGDPNATRCYTADEHIGDPESLAVSGH